MVECSKVNIKSTNTQLNKLEPAVKSNARTTLRISPKMLDLRSVIYQMNYYYKTKNKTKKCI